MLICRNNPRKKPFKMPVVKYEKTIDAYEVVDKVKIVKEAEEVLDENGVLVKTEPTYIVDKEVVLVSSVDRQKFLNEQSRDHSVYGIIDKFVNTGDLSLLHQGKEGAYGDFSQLLVDRSELVNNLANSKQEALKNIPSDLIGEQSLEEFVKNVTEEAVKKYYAAKNTKETEAKE